MMATVAIPLGLIAVALVLTLTRAARTAASDRAPDPAGHALASILAWIAFAGLAVSALLLFGVPVGLALITLPLLLGRLTPIGGRLLSGGAATLPLAWGAIVLTIVALFGVVSLYGEAMSNA